MLGVGGDSQRMRRPGNTSLVGTREQCSVATTWGGPYTDRIRYQDARGVHTWKCLPTHHNVSASRHVVEMAGIEPASLKGEPDILRAQSMLSCCSAPALAPTRCRQAQS